MKLVLLFIFIFEFLILMSFAQQEIYLPATVIDQDTIGILVLPETEFVTEMNNRQRRLAEHNQKLVRNIRFIMPYVKICAEKLQKIDEEMAKLPTEKARKEFINKAEKELMDEFEDDIRRMNFSQGKLLIKLINRETGKTSYKIIQDYKSNVSALFWQGVARFFGFNLKSTYDPSKEKEIESVLELLGYE